jgi:hypothetical protein
MKVPCWKCGELFEATSTEEANCRVRLCWQCFRAEADRVADPRYTPTVNEALRHPSEFVDAFTETVITEAIIVEKRL